MKKANLAVAIVYTAFYGLIFLAAEDADTALGIMLMSVPVVLNWLSWSKWPESK